MKEKFSKAFIVEVFNQFLSFFKSSEMSLSSIAVAYYLMLSLFPFLLIVGNALPFFHLNVDQILQALSESMPHQIYEAISGPGRSLLSNPNTSLLWVSIIVGLWTFSRALASLQMAMNKAYGVLDHRDFIVSRVIGIVSGFGILIFLYIAVLLSTFGQQILAELHSRFPFNDQLYYTLHNMTLPAVGLATFLSLALLYFLLPNVRIHKIRYIMPGTIFTTFVLVFLTNIIALYATRALNEVRDFKVAGSLVVFTLMIWFIFIARVLILGAILNAVYLQIKAKNIETRRGEVIEFIKVIRNKEKNQTD
ncbi:YihY/virulence factor BrkB family protein [Lactococcus termiticola]|uniref:Ribonuclease BN n=1 Tax=Lactococcus termiticola TaxID=2169526 RepID=A0A2R5HGJ3_9LACT|nr:YihY/virulence factor BrkB family protein [Lactococcus termiticola]GBG96976.1 ribonuclease BN [Lactococcus termiticola]